MLICTVHTSHVTMLIFKIFFIHLFFEHLQIVYSYGIFGLDNGFRFLIKDKLSTADYVGKRNETRWIEQPLDHFDINENRTWKMRYFERLDLWEEGGPIYIFIGGEGTAGRYFLYRGIMSELAKETKGAMYITEHRYYGRSMPYQHLTTENLKYLSSRQALADIAKLIKTVKRTRNLDSSKVVVIGGSYAGNLAAWMRLLYPDLVFAAIASSGPVLAKKDFYEYLEAVSDDYEQYGTEDCMDNIRRIFRTYEKLFKTKEGIEKLKKQEYICDEDDMTKPENQQLFFLDKVSEFQYRSQYGEAQNMKEHCESLRNSSHIASSIDEEPNFWNEKMECYSYDFDVMIEEMKNINWLVSWTYQTCTEFSYFQTCTSSEQPFTNNVPIELFYTLCTKFFGPEFDEARIEKGINETNALYGGLRPNVTKVIFVNGDMDPWSRLGVLEDLSYDAPAKVIPRASHCRDLFSNRDEDEEELKDARQYIKYLIQKWLGIGEWKVKL